MSEDIQDKENIISALETGIMEKSEKLINSIEKLTKEAVEGKL